MTKKTVGRPAEKDKKVVMQTFLKPNVAKSIKRMAAAEKISNSAMMEKIINQALDF